MRPKSGYIGMAVLLIVLGVVLVLVAQAWTKVSQPAIDVTRSRAKPVSDHGQTEAARQVRAGKLPDLEDVRATTNSHSTDVQQVLGSNE